MFQFRAFPSHGYWIHRAIPEYCSGVLPHSEISGSKLICSSPKLIAACHVLHRLLMPRHSPCALISLTFVRENFTPLRAPFRDRIRFVPFPLPLKSKPACAGLWICSGSLELCRLNRSCSQNCIYPFKKVFHNAVL